MTSTFTCPNTLEQITTEDAVRWAEKYYGGVICKPEKTIGGTTFIHNFMVDLSDLNGKRAFKLAIFKAVNRLLRSYRVIMGFSGFFARCQSGFREDRFVLAVKIPRRVTNKFCHYWYVRTLDDLEKKIDHSLNRILALQDRINSCRARMAAVDSMQEEVHMDLGIQHDRLVRLYAKEEKHMQHYKDRVATLSWRKP